MSIDLPPRAVRMRTVPVAHRVRAGRPLSTGRYGWAVVDGWNGFRGLGCRFLIVCACLYMVMISIGQPAEPPYYARNPWKTYLIRLVPVVRIDPRAPLVLSAK